MLIRVIGRKSVGVDSIDDAVKARVGQFSSEYDDTSGTLSDTCSDNDSGNTKQHEIALFHRNEIQTGKLLGKGCFSSVYEVSRIKLRKQTNSILTCKLRSVVQDNKGTTKEKRRSYKRDLCNNNPGRYAIKYVQKSIFRTRKGSDHFSLAAIYLASEAKILSQLNHENIVKIHGLSIHGTEAFVKHANQHDGYFIMIDRVQYSLGEKIQQWTEQQEQQQQLGGSIYDSVTMQTKIQFTLQIARALEHIHGRRIIYRDLKPENIGFKDDSTIQLLDFGFCRQLPIDCKSEHECYKMTVAGSLRYIAPEVLSTGVYNLKADVYSFALVSYYMLTLNQPYMNYDESMHETFVCERGERPIMPRTLRQSYPEVASIIRMAWDQDMTRRPSMTTICGYLDEQ